MAVVVTTPGIAAPVDQRPPSRLASGLQTARQLPIIPTAILIVLLVIPAIFANQLAPHSHRLGTLDDAKLPPFWVSESFEQRTVVQRADRTQLDTVIGMSNANGNSSAVRPPSSPVAKMARSTLASYQVPGHRRRVNQISVGYRQTRA